MTARVKTRTERELELQDALNAPRSSDAQSRMRVAIGRFMGMGEEELAEAMGLSVEELYIHYLEEMTLSLAQLRLNLAVAAYTRALNGNANAIKNLDSLMKTLLLQGRGEAQGGTASTPAPASGRYVGKKETAQREAQVAQNGTTWEELLPRSNTPVQ